MEPNLYPNQFIKNDVVDCDVVVAQVHGMIDPSERVSVECHRRMLGHLVLSLTKKFARGKRARLERRTDLDSTSTITKLYYPFWERVKRWCQRYLHATAPWFEPKPIEFPHTTNNYQVTDQVWFVIPETDKLTFAGSDRLRLLSFPSWVDDFTDKDQQLEYLQVIYRQERHIEFLLQRLSYYEGGYSDEAQQRINDIFDDYDNYMHGYGELTT